MPRGAGKKKEILAAPPRHRSGVWKDRALTECHPTPLQPCAPIATRSGGNTRRPIGDEEAGRAHSYACGPQSAVAKCGGRPQERDPGHSTARSPETEMLRLLSFTVFLATWFGSRALLLRRRTSRADAHRKTAAPPPPLALTAALIRKPIRRGVFFNPACRVVDHMARVAIACNWR